jgi:hypothetical protein
MRKYKTLIPLLFLLFSACFIYANNTNKNPIIRISGQIIQSKNLVPIPFATILIKGTRQGTICDSLGIFHLQVQQGDTLQIKALGFKGIDWKIPLITDTEIAPFFKIKLENTSYLLDDVDVYALGTWEEFKEEFIHSDLPMEVKPTADLNISKVEMQNIKDEIAFNTAPDMVGGLISYASKLFMKKKKPIIILSDETKGQHAQILNSKYNKKLIAELTHEKGSRLDELIIFINSRTNFTFENNELFIQTKIVELYEEFKQNPENETKQKIKIDSSKQIINPLRP